MSHTPGPWDWLAIGAHASGGHHLYIIDANNRKIAALWGKADEKESNARLIVAAPEVTECLIALAAELRDRYAELGPNERRLLERADAAIAEATGNIK